MHTSDRICFTGMPLYIPLDDDLVDVGTCRRNIKDE